MTIGTLGFYIMPAIEPYVKETRTPSRVVSVLPNGRLLLEDLTLANYFIETPETSFESSDNPFSL